MNRTLFIAALLIFLLNCLTAYEQIVDSSKKTRNLFQEDSLFVKSYISETDLKSYKDSALNLVKCLVENDSLMSGSKKYDFTGTTTLSSRDSKIISSELEYTYKPIHFLGIRISDSTYINGKKIFLTKLDTLFMNSIMNQVKKCQLPNDLSHKVNIISIDSIKLNEKYFQHYKSFSMPYFTKDYRIAFIEINEICIPECGSGELYVCFRTMNGWRIQFNYPTWIN